MIYFENCAVTFGRRRSDHFLLRLLLLFLLHFLLLSEVIFPLLFILFFGFADYFFQLEYVTL